MDSRSTYVTDIRSKYEEVRSIVVVDVRSHILSCLDDKGADGAWLTCSSAAEYGLLQAHQSWRATSWWNGRRGGLRIRFRRVGGILACRLQRFIRADSTSVPLVELLYRFLIGLPSSHESCCGSSGRASGQGLL